MSEVEIKKLSQSQWLLMVVVICLLLAVLISLREILMPFAIGALIAYLGDPLVDRLEERGFSRTNGVMIVFGLFLGLLVLVIAVIAPLLFKQLSELAFVRAEVVLINRVGVFWQWEICLEPFGVDRPVLEAA